MEREERTDTNGHDDRRGLHETLLMALRFTESERRGDASAGGFALQRSRDRTRHVPLSIDDESELKASLRSVKQDCAQLLDRLKTISDQVVATPEPEKARTDARFAFLLAKRQRLRAEISVLEDVTIDSFDVSASHSLVAGQVHAVARLEREIKENETAKQFIAGEIQQCENEVNWVRQRIVEHEKITVELDQRIEKLKRGRRHFADAIGTSAGLRKKIARSCDVLDRGLCQFLDEHFPPLQETSKNGVPYVALSEMVTEFLETLLKDPKDAGIDLDDRYWPPYVELLRRAGVIDKVGGRFQMVDFAEGIDDIGV